MKQICDMCFSFSAPAHALSLTLSHPFPLLSHSLSLPIVNLPKVPLLRQKSGNCSFQNCSWNEKKNVPAAPPRVTTTLLHFNSGFSFSFLIFVCFSRVFCIAFAFFKRILNATSEKIPKLAKKYCRSQRQHNSYKSCNQRCVGSRRGENTLCDFGWAPNLCELLREWIHRMICEAPTSWMEKINQTKSFYTDR